MSGPPTIQLYTCPNCGNVLPDFYRDGKHRCSKCKKLLIVLPIRTIEGNRLGVIENEYFVVHYHIDLEMIEKT